MSDPLFDRVDKSLDILKVRLQTLRLSMPDPKKPRSVPIRDLDSPNSSVNTLNLDTGPQATPSIRHATNLWRASQRIFREAETALQQGIDLVLHQNRLVSEGKDYMVPTDPNDPTDPSLKTIGPRSNAHKALALGYLPQTTYSTIPPPPPVPHRHPDHNMLAMRLSHLNPIIESTVALQTTSPSSWSYSSSPTLISPDSNPPFPARTSSLLANTTFMRRIHDGEQLTAAKIKREIHERFMAEREAHSGAAPGEEHDPGERMKKGIRRILSRAKGARGQETRRDVLGSAIER